MIKYIFTFIILSLITTNSFAQQFYEQQMLKIHIDSTLIKNQGIKSMQMFQEIAEKELRDAEYSMMIKRLAIEFNSEGQRSYVKRLPADSHSRYFGGEECIHEKYKYDEYGNVTEYCTNQEYFNYCQNYTHDSDRNLTSLSVSGEHMDATELVFEWKRGKMVSVQVNGEDEEGNIREFNELGKVSKLVFDNFRQDYVYETNGDTLLTKVNTYRKDTLFEGHELKTIKNQVISFYQFNHNADTTKSYKAKYDDHGNAVWFQYIDFSDVINGPEPIYSPKSSDNQTTIHFSQPKPTINQADIKNYYDNSGLLIKREVFNTNRKEDSYLSAIHYLIYDKAPLVSKPWPQEKKDDTYYEVEPK